MMGLLLQGHMSTKTIQTMAEFCVFSIFFKWYFSISFTWKLGKGSTKVAAGRNWTTKKTTHENTVLHCHLAGGEYSTCIVPIYCTVHYTSIFTVQYSTKLYSSFTAKLFVNRPNAN